MPGSELLFVGKVQIIFFLKKEASGVCVGCLVDKRLLLVGYFFLFFFGETIYYFR